MLRKQSAEIPRDRRPSLGPSASPLTRLNTFNYVRMRLYHYKLYYLSRACSRSAVTIMPHVDCQNVFNFPPVLAFHLSVGSTTVLPSNKSLKRPYPSEDGKIKVVFNSQCSPEHQTSTHSFYKTWYIGYKR